MKSKCSVLYNKYKYNLDLGKYKHKPEQMLSLAWGYLARPQHCPQSRELASLTPKRKLRFTVRVGKSKKALTNAAPARGPLEPRVSCLTCTCTCVPLVCQWQCARRAHKPRTPQTASTHGRPISFASLRIVRKVFLTLFVTSTSRTSGPNVLVISSVFIHY